MAKLRRTKSVEKEPGLYLFRDTWKGCEVKALSYAAKGLWIDMLVEMTGTEIPGVLPGNLETLAEVLGFGAMASVWVDMHKPLLEEMERKHVFSRGAEMGEELDPNCIVNRRMYRQWCKALGVSEANRQNVMARWNKTRQAGCTDGVSILEVLEDLQSGELHADTNAYEFDTNHIRDETPEVLESKHVTTGGKTEDDTKKYLSLPLTKPTPTPSGTGRTDEEVQERGYARHLYERLQKATRVQGRELDWWRKVIAVLRKRGHLGLIEEHLRYVEECADPAKRANRDQGPLNQPNRYLAKNVLASSRKLPHYHNRSTLPVPEGKWRLPNPPWQEAA